MDNINKHSDYLKKDKEQRLENLKKEIAEEEANKEKIRLSTKENLQLFGAILFVIFSFFYWVGSFYLLEHNTK